jgi:membrane dipeptidase
VPPTETSSRGRELLSRFPLIDGHNDLPWAMRLGARYDFEQMDPGVGISSTHTDIPRLRAGGVGGQFWSVYVPSTLPGHEAVTATLEQVEFVHRMVERYPDDLELALTADDVERAFSSGRVASMLGAEGGHSIGCSMGALRALYRLGVRYMTLTHNDNIPWADAATDKPAVGGLTAFGREVVREMNRLGMLVDLSHVAPSTMHAAIDASEAPVIFSHSCCRAVVDHVRNVPDDVLRLLPDNGGVCMISFVPDFVSEACRTWRVGWRAAMDAQGIDIADAEARKPATKAFVTEHPRPVATLADVVTHLEHARELIGIEHLGVGGDYDGVDVLPEGLHDVTGYPALLDELLDRGWSEDDCRAVAGGNVLRALRGAESVATRAQADRAPSLARIEDLDAAG